MDGADWLDEIETHWDGNDKLTIASNNIIWFNVILVTIKLRYAYIWHFPIIFSVRMLGFLFEFRKKCPYASNYNYSSICSDMRHLVSMLNNCYMEPRPQCPLVNSGRVMQICVGNLNTIVSDNGLSPGRHQATICTNAGIMLIGSLGTNFGEILIQIFSFKKIQLKISSGKWRSFCLVLNMLTNRYMNKRLVCCGQHTLFNFFFVVGAYIAWVSSLGSNWV